MDEKKWSKEHMYVKPNWIWIDEEANQKKRIISLLCHGTYHAHLKFMANDYDSIDKYVCLNFIDRKCATNLLKMEEKAVKFKWRQQDDMNFALFRDIHSQWRGRIAMMK